MMKIINLRLILLYLIFACTAPAYSFNIKMGLGTQISAYQIKDHHQYFSATNLYSSFHNTNTNPIFNLQISKLFWQHKQFSAGLFVSTHFIIGQQLKTSADDNFFLIGTTYLSLAQQYNIQSGMLFNAKLAHHQQVYALLGIDHLWYQGNLAYNVGHRSPFDPDYPGYDSTFHFQKSGLFIGLGYQLSWNKHDQIGLQLTSSMLTNSNLNIHVKAYPNPNIPSSVLHQLHMHFINSQLAFTFSRRF